MSINQTPPSFSQRIYRILLYAYPASFRHDYAALMEQHFADCCRLAHHEPGPAALLRFWGSSLGDLLGSALMEHLAEMRATRGWMWPLALLLGLGIGYVDYTATEVQATLLVLLPVAFGFGLAAPRSAWRWALLLGLCIPLVHILLHMFNVRPPYPDFVIETLLALIPAFLAAYSGAALRWLVKEMARN
jgi:hypothetical protein